MKRFKLTARSVRASVLLFPICAVLHCQGQTNSWTNAASGYWDDPDWSLGELPGPGQTILFTNAGWKALAIGTNASQNFPQTLTVDSLTISSPGTDTVNELLFNYAGFQVPLTLNSLAVGTNCRVSMLSSMLVVSNLSVSGAFTQDVNSIVSGTNSHLAIGDTGSGTYDLESGTLVAGDATVGTSFPSLLVQNGGSNACAWVHVLGQSEFDQDGGVFTGGAVVESNGVYQQSGGIAEEFNAELGVNGTFVQSGGARSGEELDVPNLFMEGHFGSDSQGSVLQTGGTNEQSRLEVGYNLGAVVLDGPGTSLPTGSGDYTLSNGVVNTAVSYVAADGTMAQWGGTHITQGLNVAGAVRISAFNTVDSIDEGLYTLGNGLLRANAVNINGEGVIIQSGGTNDIFQELSISATINPIGDFDGHYLLKGGLVQTPSLTVSQGAVFYQNDGQVVVSNIFLSGALFQQDGGSITQSGQLLVEASRFHFGAGTQQMGQLLLDNFGGTNCYFDLPVGPCIVRFADSSALAWSNNVNLTVDYWAGSISGGGNQQIIFGNSSSALTTQQLAQITFHDPVGLAAEDYPAVILATGEVVPDAGAFPSLSVSTGPSADSIELSLHGGAGKTYEIDVSSNLVDWTVWTNTVDAGGTVTFTDSTTNSPVRFYRSRLSP